MTQSCTELVNKLGAASGAWRSYVQAPQFEAFVEFAVSLSSFAGFLADKAMSGLHQAAHQLEEHTLDLFGSEASHPLPESEIAAIGSMLATLEERVAALSGAVARTPPEPERRADQVEHATTAGEGERRVCFVGDDVAPWAELLAQLAYFGIRPGVGDWLTPTEAMGEPAQILLDIGNLSEADVTARVGALRQRFALANLIALNVAAGFASMHTALAAGCDHCFIRGTGHAAIMGRILEQNIQEEEAPYRVLVVEDSKTASAAIQRILANNNVESVAIGQPQQVLDELQRYQPDLILMDMHMPGCTGIEAARVIRQYPQFLSTPIVYLSGETDVARQIDALRLGGDHFLTKPVNPVILNAIVKTKIDRYRHLRRSMSNDSLTGLLNHTSSKQHLDVALSLSDEAGKPMAVAMIDIDHFKKVNDSYGHPMGDQIIRSLAWLLKQRLRKTDIIGRYGGEEFIVGLPGANPERAMETLERIRVDFSQIRHPFNDSFFNTTFSSGMAHFPAIGNREALVKAADEALYEAKRSGRNRVVSYAGQ